MSCLWVLLIIFAPALVALAVMTMIDDIVNPRNRHVD